MGLSVCAAAGNSNPVAVAQAPESGNSTRFRLRRQNRDSTPGVEIRLAEKSAQDRAPHHAGLTASSTSIS